MKAKEDECLNAVPLLCRLEPHALSTVLGLHGGRLKEAEQHPMGKIAQVRWAQVTRFLLKEVTHNILRNVRRAAIQSPRGKRDNKQEVVRNKEKIDTATSN